jgi:hypothetical protein
MTNIDKNADSKEETYFRDTLAKFEKTLDLAMRFSARCDNMLVEQRRAWASWLFLRLCIIGQSISQLANLKGQLDDGKVWTLDHNSIAAVARNIIEATLMFFYVSELNIDEAEWSLRKNVLDLHDCLTRYRIFKVWKSDEETKRFGSMASEIREKIRNHEIYKRLDTKKQKQLLSGQQLYINGLRAVVRQAGWDVDQFDGVYAYLSGHSHSAPISFYRIGQHGIDFSRPSGHQFGLAGFAIEHADQCIGAACKRLIDVFPNKFPEVQG